MRLDRLERAEGDLAVLEQRIQEKLEPYTTQPALLDEIPDVDIGHKILVSIYPMVSQNVLYNDLGDLYLDKLNKNHVTRNLVHRLERLGHSVTLAPQQKAA